MFFWLFLWIPLLVVCTGWSAQAIAVAMQARKFSRRVARPPHEGFDAYQPPATVIVPFKGHDDDLPRHLRALVTQDYAEYRLILVFEDQEDPARRAIELELEQNKIKPPVDIVIAGLAPDDTGQKVHNQLAALAHLEAVGDTSEVWAFADSDAVPGSGWLRKLVAPLADPTRIGVTTGYRWLMPELRAQRPTTPSMFASVINSSVATLIGHGTLAQAWGGSMAVRADFAREHGLTDNYLRGSLSDDYQMTRMCRDASKRLYFVTHCLVPSPVRFTWREFFEFGRRQYLITRAHDQALYKKAVAAIGFYLLANVSCVVGLIAALPSEEWGVAIYAGATLLTVGVANQFRAFYRRRAIAAAFGRDQLRYLRHTVRLDRFGTFVVMAVNLTLLLSAARGKRLTWRGNTYELNGPQSIRRLP
ncbi:MAG: glycosyltransferase family 2 protein [Planctomycetota bacterium]